MIYIETEFLERLQKPSAHRITFVTEGCPVCHRLNAKINNVKEKIIGPVSHPKPVKIL